MNEALQKTLQTLIDNELGKIDALFHSADANASGVDVRAVAAFLDAHELDGLLGKLNNQVNALKQLFNDQLTEQFALLGVQSMNVNGSTVYKNVERYANAKPECRRQLVEWARENGLDDMVVVQPQRFKSWCRELLEGEDGGLPAAIADMVEVFEKPSLRIRRG
jgi:hypothetical protein